MPTQPVFQEASSDFVFRGITTGYKWSFESAVPINWSLSGGFAAETWSNPATLATQVADILSQFSSYADIQFNQVGTGFSDAPTAAAAGSNINFAPGTFVSATTWSFVFAPNPAENSFYQGAPGDIFVNRTSPAGSLTDFSPGTAGGTMFMHALGHSLGLKHPQDASWPGHEALGEFEIEGFEAGPVSIMDYTEETNFSTLAAQPGSLMILDVLGIQALYGPNLGTAADDTTHGLQLAGLFTTIWDAGGRDTASAQGSTSGWTIALPNFQPIGVLDTKVGFAVPTADLATGLHGYWLAGNIENATGGDVTDYLLGSDLANVLRGMGGGDSLQGGGGADIVVGDNRGTVAGNEGGDVIYGGAGSDVIVGGAGNDTSHGGSEHDWLTGEDGDDTQHGDDGDDAIFGDFGHDLLFGDDGHDLLVGGAGLDLLHGGFGMDWLFGGLPSSLVGSGTDTLRGGLDADVLFGGDENDIFVFSVDDGIAVDTVMDFAGGEDLIQLEGLTVADGLGTSVVTLSNGAQIAAANAYEWLAEDFF